MNHSELFVGLHAVRAGPLDLVDLKSYFSVYSMYRLRRGLLCRRVQPLGESAISAAPCGGMRGGWSCCPSSLCSVHSEFMPLYAPSRETIMNGGRIFLPSIRRSLTPIIAGGRSLRRC